jgi:uncharacterized protein with FMN-binding domain
MKKIFIVLSFFIGFAFIMGLIMYIRITENSKAILNIEISEIDFSTFEDGAYTGMYYRDSIGTEVIVTIESGQVTEIEYFNHQAAKGLVAEAIKDVIISEQSIIVDDYAGATISSRCIKLAIINAFSEE